MAVANFKICKSLIFHLGCVTSDIKKSLVTKPLGVDTLQERHKLKRHRACRVKMTKLRLSIKTLFL
jgi:hypothetical protein